MNPGTHGPYEQLLALATSELELARERRLPELAACQQARAALMATLPATPPPEARAALERCRAVQDHLENELRQARHGVLAALADLQRAQRAADGYRPRRPRPRVINADA